MIGLLRNRSESMVGLRLSSHQIIHALFIQHDIRRRLMNQAQLGQSVVRLISTLCVRVHHPLSMLTPTICGAQKGCVVMKYLGACEMHQFDSIDTINHRVRLSRTFCRPYNVLSHQVMREPLIYALIKFRERT
jgi:hypothetical protein